MPRRPTAALAALLAVAVLAACSSTTELPLDRAADTSDVDDHVSASRARGEAVTEAGAGTGAEPSTTSTAPTTTATEAPSTTTTEAEPVDPFSIWPPEPPGDPAALAREIAESEAVVRDGGATEADVAAAGLALQVAYRKLGATPEWDEAVFAELPRELHFAATTNAAARREFHSMHRTLGQNVPGWKIIEPAPAEQLLEWYREAEAEFGVPWNILAAVNLVETGMGRIEGYSSAGARGPMQFMPLTWDAYGEGDIDDPHDAIRAAARYLAANGGGRGEIDNALFRYNRDNRYVRGVKHYAEVIGEHPGAFLAYYHWGIFYLTAHGDVFLPIGYDQPEPLPALEYLARGAAG